MDNVTEQERIYEILQKMFNKRGFDVRNYKMSNLQRRISRRMDVLGISSLVEYSEYLDANPDEYEVLFDTILVNVSQFFRDPEAWDFVRENVLPEILSKGGEIRIWSAGCASGEEPYSTAIMLTEMLGDGLSEFSVNIYATDVDEAALKFARSGTYTLDQLSGMPEGIREKYFSHHGDVYTIARDIRNLLIFSRHNLISDPPMSRIDLLICRNVLIYFDQVLQSRIVPRLQYALNDTGYLWLGKAETMASTVHSLRPMNTRWRIYRKIQPSNSLQMGNLEYSDTYTESDLIRVSERFKQIIQSVKAGLIMLDKNFTVVMCNQAIQEIWDLLPEQILNKPFFDLEISYSPVDLRHRVEQAVATGESSVVENAEYWVTKDKRIYLKVEIIPVLSGVIIFLENVTEQYELNKELQVTNKALEASNEKLLAANEELENSNRQLQYINEELQSTNEELESTNEELKATNEELSARVVELNTLKNYYETVFNSINFGVISTDKDLLVRTLNDAAANLWKSVEVKEAIGTPLMELDMGLPLEVLTDQLREVIRTSKPASEQLEYLDRWGEKATVDVSVTPIVGEKSDEPDSSEAKGLVLVFKEADHEESAEPQRKDKRTAGAVQGDRAGYTAGV
jgi:two-component system CheB/CheR fusion protein